MHPNYARSFKDLRVYKRAKKVSHTVFICSKEFPRNEMFSLTDQFRRAARSIGAQIAEAWGKRRYERHFVNKLTDADSEQMETQHWVEEAFNCGYLSRENAEKLNSDLMEIGRMLNSMIKKSELFCSSDDEALHEPAIEYFIATMDQD